MCESAVGDNVDISLRWIRKCELVSQVDAADTQKLSWEGLNRWPNSYVITYPLMHMMLKRASGTNTQEENDIWTLQWVLI